MLDIAAYIAIYGCHAICFHREFSDSAIRYIWLELKPFNNSILELKTIRAAHASLNIWTFFYASNMPCEEVLITLFINYVTVTKYTFALLPFTA